jgi:hypothetical protein
VHFGTLGPLKASTSLWVEKRHGTQGQEKTNVLEEFRQRRKERDAPLSNTVGTLATIVPEF